MDYYAGIDMSLELSSVCVVDSSGKIVRETKVASEPEALSQHFTDLGLSVARVGLEAGPLSQMTVMGPEADSPVLGQAQPTAALRQATLLGSFRLLRSMPETCRSFGCPPM